MRERWKTRRRRELNNQPPRLVIHTNPRVYELHNLFFCLRCNNSLLKLLLLLRFIILCLFFPNCSIHETDKESFHTRNISHWSPRPFMDIYFYYYFPSFLPFPFIPPLCRTILSVRPVGRRMLYICRLILTRSVTRSYYIIDPRVAKGKEAGPSRRIKLLPSPSFSLCFFLFFLNILYVNV